jgi:hypothetical protein
MRARSGAPQTSANQLPQWGAAAPAPADQLMRAMTDMLNRQHPASAAEALKALRHRYPDIPLALRIAALRAGSAK